MEQHSADCASLRPDRLWCDCNCGVYGPASDQDYDGPYGSEDWPKPEASTQE